MFCSTGAHACLGGGYEQVYPLAHNQGNQLWVLYVSAGRGGEGTEFSFETQLKLLDSQLRVIDSIEVSKGKKDLKSLPNYGMVQFPSELDSLYCVAVQRLKSVDSNLRFLNIVGTSQLGVDSFADIHLLKKQVITQMSDTNYHRDGMKVRNYADTVFYYQKILVGKMTFEVDSLETFYSSSVQRDFLGWHWSRVNLHGVKYYELDGVKYLVLHCEVMFGMKDGYQGFQINKGSAETWKNAMYQPIGWHHNGQGILLKIE